MLILNKPIKPIMMRYNATIKFNKRGMTRISMPAMSETNGVRLRWIFMIALSYGG